MARGGSPKARRQCHFTGRRTVSGWTKSEKGKRKDGGVGNKVKGRTKRAVKPNLRKVRCVVNGEVKRIYVSTKAIRSGLVVKPLKKTVSA
ncbi:MAG: 50S ribosomal protein L28 [Planctomycetota bacterium]|jgi:large subunit ribosomal protein L28|nr:50S ribosomal protein L28 [Planctomycetota bacterium]